MWLRNKSWLKGKINGGLNEEALTDDLLFDFLNEIDKEYVLKALLVVLTLSEIYWPCKNRVRNSYN